MIRFSTAVVAGIAILAGAEPDQAQNWTGWYAGASAGAGFQKQKTSVLQTVRVGLSYRF